MFCAAHALSMACDSLYAAWLKTHYPYEFYTTMLKLYTEKGNKEKIALIVDEMKRYIGVSVVPGCFGEDNRDWYIDKQNARISQNLNSIKFISPNVAEEMLAVASRPHDSFVEILRDIQMNTRINARQVDVLLELDYFKNFGSYKKLQKIIEEFRTGANRLTKTLSDKSVEKRMKQLVEMERSEQDSDEPIYRRLRAEFDYMGRCLSADENADPYTYFVEEVDDQYGVKASLYSPRSGKHGVMRVTKDTYGDHKFQSGQLVSINGTKGWERKPRYRFHDGVRTIVEGEYDIWLRDYEVIEPTTEEKCA